MSPTVTPHRASPERPDGARASRPDYARQAAEEEGEEERTRESGVGRSAQSLLRAGWQGSRPAASHCHLGRGPEAPRHLVGHIFAWQPCVPARCSVIPHSVPVSLHQRHQEASSRRRSFWAYARQNTEHLSNASCMNDVAIWPVATTGSVESARDQIIRPFCIAMCLSMKEGCSICFFCRILIHHHYQHRKKMRI